MAITETITRMLNANTSRQLGKIFMAMYRLGYNDSCLKGDNFIVEDTLERLEDCDTFGRVGEIRVSWGWWENRMMDIAEDLNLHRIMRKYFTRMGYYGRNYLSAALALSKDFYMWGCRDWLEYGEPDFVDMLRCKPLGWIVNHDVSKREPYHLVMKVQDICDDHVAKIAEGKREIVNKTNWLAFRKTFSLTMGK